MEQGLLGYMKNVHVRNPEFSLDCTGPLKIYLQYVEKKGKKKPSDRRKEEGKEIDKSGPVLPNDGNFDFNSIKKVTASGNVVLRYTDKDGNGHLRCQYRGNHSGGQLPFPFPRRLHL